MSGHTAEPPEAPEIEIEMETAEPPPSSIVRGFLSFPTDPPPESVLAGNAWLRIGDVIFFNSSAGSGKSVGAVQMALAWALGLPYFGIRPARPLRVLHFVGEDDESTLGQCREGLLDNSVAIFGRELLREELGKLDEMVRTEFARLYTGDAFIAHLDHLLTEEPADLVIINPLLSYIGGEIVANASRFLRDGLMPMLQKHNCAAMVAHHTPKLAKDSWENMDPVYSGTGGGEVANAPRALLVLMPTKVADLHVLRSAKRKTTGWKDDDDKFTDHAFFRRTDNPQRPAWLPVGHDEAADLIAGCSGPEQGKKRKAGPEAVVAAVASGAMERQALLEEIQRTCKCSDRPAKDALKEARELKVVETFEKPNPRGGKAILWVCLPEQKAQWVA
ncbi:AAA family ATPase [Luteolibacter sp. Populi]|uniref:AAA family ATPase n=1 Tax=Luteolibacter sp. Populi TaxID=3230487 RepID=UPI00346765D2